MTKEKCINKVVEIINGISDEWLLEQIYRCAVNVVKDETNDCMETKEEKDLDGAAFDASAELEKAISVLRTTIDNFNFDCGNMSDMDGIYLARRISTIGDLLYVVHDYILKANELLCENM